MIPEYFDFRTALMLLMEDNFKSPLKRKSWPDDKFIVMQKGYPDGISCNKQTAEAWGMKEGDLFKCEPYLQIQEDGTHYMWTPSTADLFADDWTYAYIDE